MKEDLEALDREMLHRLTASWLDEPFVDGKLTPRQAVHNPEGRKKMVEVLKQIEYMALLRMKNVTGLVSCPGD